MTTLYREQCSRVGRWVNRAIFTVRKWFKSCSKCPILTKQVCNPPFSDILRPMVPLFFSSRTAKYPKIGPKHGIKNIADRTGDGDFYFNWRYIRQIPICHKNKNPRLLCDLYEPWIYIFHPLTSMVILAHPEVSGSNIKYQFQVNHTLLCSARIWAAIPYAPAIFC